MYGAGRVEADKSSVYACNKLARGWGLYSLWDAHIDHQMLTGAYRLSDICDVCGCLFLFLSKVEGEVQSFYIFTFVS